MGFFDSVHEKFDAVFTDVWDFLAPIVKIFMSKGGDILKDTAMTVVKEIAKDPSLIASGGLAKRQAAFDRITTNLKDSAPQLISELGESVINLAIEAAVQKVKAEGAKVEE
jgi:hypothetical protein